MLLWAQPPWGSGGFCPSSARGFIYNCHALRSSLCISSPFEYTEVSLICLIKSLFQSAYLDASLVISAFDISCKMEYCLLMQTLWYLFLASIVAFLRQSRNVSNSTLRLPVFADGSFWMPMPYIHGAVIRRKHISFLEQRRRFFKKHETLD